MKIAAALMLIASCAAESPRALIHVDLVQPGVPDAYVAALAQGADAWAEFGIASGDAPIACAPAWWLDAANSAPCGITIAVTFWPASQLAGAAGLTSNHQTQIAQELTGDHLISVAAHEFGHTIWNTSDHLLPGEVGIMSAITTFVDAPTDADARFVQRHEAAP